MNRDATQTTKGTKESTKVTYLATDPVVENKVDATKETEVEVPSDATKETEVEVPSDTTFNTTTDST